MWHNNNNNNNNNNYNNYNYNNNNNNNNNGNNNGLFDRSTGWLFVQLHYLQFKINDNIYNLKKNRQLSIYVVSRILLWRREMKQLKLPDSPLGGTLSVHWVQKFKNCLIRYNFNPFTPKISWVILVTVGHTLLIMLVQGI